MDSFHSVGMLFHYDLNFESFFWAWELILDETSGTIDLPAKFYTLCYVEIADFRRMQEVHAAT